MPEATPDGLNRSFVGVGPRVAGDVRARGVPLDLPCRLPRVGACAFFLKPMTIDSLRPVLFSMNNSGACGADGICITLIQICFEIIGHVFLHILNTCFTTRQYPDSWKHSIVHPIHKSGSPSDASNFRPISIVPAFKKLVERVVQRQLYSYMSDNDLFSSSQHGFRSRLSTETALLTVSDHILAATDCQGRSSLFSASLIFPNACICICIVFAFRLQSDPLSSLGSGLRHVKQAVLSGAALFISD